MSIEEVVVDVISDEIGHVITPQLAEYLADRIASKAHVARLLREPEVVAAEPVYIGEWPPRVVRKVRYNERPDRVGGGASASVTIPENAILMHSDGSWTDNKTGRHYPASEDPDARYQDTIVVTLND